MEELYFENMAKRPMIYINVEDCLRIIRPNLEVLINRGYTKEKAIDIFLKKI